VPGKHDADVMKSGSSKSWWAVERSTLLEFASSDTPVANEYSSTVRRVTVLVKGYGISDLEYHQP
jgi:hypothetical protein